MSYPAPPPPGGAGDTPPYQPPAGNTPAGSTPAGGAPYGQPYGGSPYGSPYGSAPYGQPPKKKDNTLWWILGIIGVVVILCCCAGLGFVGFVTNEASKGISSYTSSANSSKDADAAGGTVVAEGDAVTVGGAAIQSGWSVVDDDVSGLSVRNESGSDDSFYLTFYFMEGGHVVDDVTCNTSYLTAGSTDASPTCLPAIFDVSGYEEIRVTEGY